MYKAKTTGTEIATVIKATVVGLLSSEAWYLGSAFRPALVGAIAHGHHETGALVLGIVGFALLALYIASRDLAPLMLRIMKSARLDVFFAFLFGASVSIASGGLGSSQYAKLALLFSPGALATLVAVPFGLAVALLLGKLKHLLFKRQPAPDSFFISDAELKEPADDLLRVGDEAIRFAERVVNQGSPQSMAFGIDAPWGIGKSTFVNFCIRHWETAHAKDVLVYDFNPLRYEGRANLLENFVDGLIRVIQKSSFLPEARPLISQYSRLIKGAKAGFSVLDLEVMSGTYTIDDAFNDLDAALSTFDKKIIVVVDDLDRLTFATIKEVLFAIKKGFTLPNISYVLSYDTQNIGALEESKPDTDKVTEFLEKFINVKVSLYLDSATLIRYLSDNLAQALSGNSQADPQLVSKAMGGLVDILKSKDYFAYQALVGDIRKIKRLINTVLVLEVQNTDFDNSDFNREDLIHLLLIYINHPNVFRAIYDSETQGRMGFFSVVAPYEPGYPTDSEAGAANASGNYHYRNSKQYTEFVKTLSQQQQFLVGKVFTVADRLGGTQIGKIKEDARRSYACFNGGGNTGRNLTEYLELIVKLSKPQKASQYHFYLNCKNAIAKGEALEDVLSSEEFVHAKTENTHRQLWRVLVNSAGDLDGSAAARIITYLLENIHTYSLFIDDTVGVGLRHDLAFYLVKLIDAAGWGGQVGARLMNSDEGIVEITEWIFGEGRHVGGGIIEALSAEDRGLLGLNDLLAFRLHCSADRGGEVFNVQRALSQRGDPDAPTSGLTTLIAIAEMREISQRIFQRFDEQYIQGRRNIFTLAESLSLAEFTGAYKTLVERGILDGQILDPERRVSALRSQVKAFVTYQLGSSIVDLGVGCGYYDEIGTGDGKGIAGLMNDYLFDTCFDAANPANFEHFLDYLLISFSSTFGFDGRGIAPRIEEFTKVLNEARLTEYWVANGNAIKALNFTDRDKKVYAANYVASYKVHLDAVYAVLDRQTATLLPPAAQSSPY